MSMQACFPSMNPLGMAFAARISYLPKDGYVREVEMHWVVLYRQPGGPACQRQSWGWGARTAGGTPGRQSCWGIPAGRYGSLPGHHCSATAPALNGHQVCQTAKGTEGIFSTDLQKCYHPHVCVWRHHSALPRAVSSSTAVMCQESEHLKFTLFSWFGMIQRTKLGLVFLRVVISLVSCSL